jgi:hypothetical protein
LPTLRKRSFKDSKLWYIYFHSYIVFIVSERSVESRISAHDTDVGAVTINADGTLIATASIKGTIIKIYSTEEGVLL